MNILQEKFKEVLTSVLPITFIVLILHVTVVPLTTPVLLRFLLGSVFVIIGLTLFLLGVDIGITPIGTLMGRFLAKTNKLPFILMGGLLLGFFISVAEPDLHILAKEVSGVTNGTISRGAILMVVSIGVAALVAFGLFRIVRNLKLRVVLFILYGAILVLSLFSTPEFLAISFDASGATTGAMTVPFILALALGTASMKRDSKSAEEDSFGLLGLASSGAILAVLVMSIFSKSGPLTGTLEHVSNTSLKVLPAFGHNFVTVGGEVLLALSPIVVLFLLCQKIFFKLDSYHFKKILKGLVYTFVGLAFFLTGVNAGFMDVGRFIGYTVAHSGNRVLLVFIGLVLGLVTILAEPAVHVLTKQIEDVTSGSVKKRLVLLALSIGVGCSIALSVIRILIPTLQLWHFLLPGYLISLGMTFFVPDLFIGIAFDSGGVASGPMAATFILAFTQGAAEAVSTANVLTDGFGVIAMVAMTPLIALQTLGFAYHMKAKKKKRRVLKDGVK